MGVEPTSQPWEGRILPMKYTREHIYYSKSNAQNQGLFGILKNFFIFPRAFEIFGAKAQTESRKRLS